MPPINSFTRTLRSSCRSRVSWVGASCLSRRYATEAQIQSRTESSQGSWKTTRSTSFTQRNLLDLLDGRIPAMHDPKFLSANVCETIEDELSPRLSPYLHVAGPPVSKVGIAQFEFQAQSADDFGARDVEVKNKYFESAKQHMNMHDEFGKRWGVNPLQEVMKVLLDMVPPGWEVGLASEGPDKKYFSGIYRAINQSTPVHCDWSPYDSATEDWIVNQVTSQLVFNLYFTPITGGATTIYDKQWTHDALKHRDPQTYGYFPSVVDGAAHSVVQPQRGELCFFNTRNFHKVDSVAFEDHSVHGRWQRPRLTLSSFIGYLPPNGSRTQPRLLLWS